MIKIKLLNKRLVWFKEKPDVTYWNAHWQESSIRIMVRLARNSRLADIFMRRLSNTTLILEAGCGLAQWVKVLDERGFNIIGIDVSISTIRKAKKYYPELKLLIGDVLALPLRDNSLDCYISLGVVEHFEEGPERALKEAYRVLKPRGTLFVSVPYFNPLRRVKAALGFYRKEKRVEPCDFYQYAFTVEEFFQILKRCGFIPSEIIPYDPFKGFKDEIFIIRKIYSKIKGEPLQKYEDKHYRKILNKALNSWRSLLINNTLIYDLINKIAAHMILFVAKTSKGESVNKSEMRI